VPKTSDFIGRKQDLESIKRQLTPREARDRRKICVIYGLGGMGKSQLAIEYARLHKDLYTSFFWIDGKTEESLIQSLIRIALRLPMSNQSYTDMLKTRGLEESRKAAQGVLEWFALKGNTQWLLVFDNIDETSYEEESDQHTKMSSYNITRYFPRGDTGSIIITTRLQRLVSLGSPIYLQALKKLDSLLVLENHVRRNLRPSHPQATSKERLTIEDWDPG
jgi:hypothetical protein